MYKIWVTEVPKGKEKFTEQKKNFFEETMTKSSPTYGMKPNL